MEKQPVPTECFVDAFLEYLRVRFEFEPLPHYVMAAMHLSHESSRDYPEFVRAFFAWFADSFLFDMYGTFPAQSHNADPADARWRRYADCHALLEGWLNDDLEKGLALQERRLELVDEVEIKLTEVRDDPAGKAARKRTTTTKTQAQVFEELEDETGIKAHTLRRNFKKLAHPEQYMSGVIPIALVRTDGVYEIHFRYVAQ